MRFWLLVLVLIAGAAALLFGSGWGMDDPVWLPLAAIGVAMMVYVIMAARSSLRRLEDDLRAGKDVIARWQVCQADLDAFLAIDRARGELGIEYHNFLNFPKTVPPEGFPVIIGKRDWLIGDRLYRGSPPGGDLFCCIMQDDGDPGFIEFAKVSRSSGAGYFLTLSRLPVPVAAREKRLQDIIALSVASKREIDQWHLSPNKCILKSIIPFGIVPSFLAILQPVGHHLRRAGHELGFLENDDWRAEFGHRPGQFDQQCA